MTRRKIPHLRGESIKILQEAVKAEETWLQYERRFWRFLRWLGENPDSFLVRSKSEKAWAEAVAVQDTERNSRREVVFKCQSVRALRSP